MHRRPNAAWVPPPAVEPGWIAGRAPAGRNPHDRVLPYTPSGMKNARPRVGGAVSGRGIRDWKGVRNSSWHCAALSALVSRSRAMPAGGRPSSPGGGSKPSPRLCSGGDARSRWASPIGAGVNTGVPWPARYPDRWRPRGDWHFHSNWPRGLHQRLLTACGQSHAAQFSRWGLGRRCIPAEPRRFASLIVAFRSKYTRASSPGGGSSLTRLVSRAPRRPRRSRHFIHRLSTRSGTSLLVSDGEVGLPADPPPRGTAQALELLEGKDHADGVTAPDQKNWGAPNGAN